MRIKYLKITIALLFAANLLSCETDKSRMEACNEVVNSFVGNLALDNYEVLYKNYPNFQKVKTYFKADDFKLISSTIDDDKTVSIMGTSQTGNILFILKKDKGKYLIVNSKGLSADFNTSLYKYCKEIGCIKADYYDKDISQVCSDEKAEFESLVDRIKENIESNVSLQNNNLSTQFGYVSGDVTFKNYSRFTIPGRTYQVYLNFFNSSGQLVFTKNDFFNFEYIPFGQSVTEHVFEDNAGNFQSIRVQLKLISTEFIEQVIAEHIKGNDCKANLDF